jgi:two-component system CheB/CheR fusion protein
MPPITASMDRNFPPAHVVCLAGSAGALAAYQAILRAIPPDSDMAFIIVAHRRPGFDHLLGPLLRSVTAMPVHDIAQGQSIERGTVLLLPARQDLAFVDGRLLLSAQSNADERITTITRFLRSLAMDTGVRSVAVILSGLADDGSAALGAIKAAGGMTFAQSDAEWSDMPMNAIRTGYVDSVLSSGSIGETLAALARARPH